MSIFREKAQGRTKQLVGQMIGDQQLVEEGKEQEHNAEPESPESPSTPAPERQVASSTSNADDA